MSSDDRELMKGAQLLLIHALADAIVRMEQVAPHTRTAERLLAATKESLNVLYTTQDVPHTHYEFAGSLLELLADSIALLRRG